MQTKRKLCRKLGFEHTNKLYECEHNEVLLGIAMAAENRVNSSKLSHHVKMVVLSFELKCGLKTSSRTIHRADTHSEMRTNTATKYKMWHFNIQAECVIKTRRSN